MLLEVVPGIAVVGEAANGEDAVLQAARLTPDVVLMDLRMPGMDGLWAIQQVAGPGRAEDGHETRVLVLTTFGDEESVAAALRSGASGFLLKDAASALLVEAIRTVASGESWLDPTASAAVIRVLQRTPAADPASNAAVDRLTWREREVLVLMARGLTNDQIRERLVLSGATVRTHVSRILAKTGVHDRSQAVALAYQAGLMSPPVTREEPSSPA